jgi:hypothetical protein
LFSLDLVRAIALVVALLLCSITCGRAFQIVYFTSLRNDSAQTIEVTPDAVDGHLQYTVKPGDTVTFLGGFSTVRFVVRTPSRVFYYAFPLSFGAKSTHYKGRQKHSYVFTRDHTISPLDPDGSTVRGAKDFPLAPHTT